MILDVNAVTLTGLVRVTNQDSIFSAYKSDIGIFLVADGMGGHYRGELASGIAAGEMSKWWEKNKDGAADQPFFTVVEALEREIKRINSMIEEQYRNMGQLGGCTFCMLLVHHNAYAVLNVGDSRLYLCERRKLRQLTVDDVWENQPQVRQMADTFDLTRDPRRGRLVRAMGIDREISVSVLTNVVAKRMVFFLCSDGIYKHLDAKQLEELLKKVKKPKDAARVNDSIKKKVYENGASDNLSMITVLVREE